jgi:hypothetical protein
MFAAPAPQSTIVPPQQQAAAPQVRPGPKRASYLPLFLILGFLLLIAIGILVFFALRK